MANVARTHAAKLVSRLLDTYEMSRPRQILPGKFWLLTRRCVQRQFLLRPDEEMNNAFLFCLIEAAITFNIRLLLPQMMSNHYHLVLFDLPGNVVEFYHRFHTNLANCVNALRGHTENVWSSVPTSLVELVDPDAVLNKLMYTATNPVKDQLVETVDLWPGPATTAALLEGRTLRARRPRFFFSADGELPDQVEMTLTFPEQMGDPELLIARMRERIAKFERACARKRMLTGSSVLGRRRVLRQSWRDRPSSHEPRGRRLRPRIAGRSILARVEAHQRIRAFQTRYSETRQRWRDGLPAVFPQGTYWLARFANVAVEGMPPRPDAQVAH